MKVPEVLETVKIRPHPQKPAVIVATLRLKALPVVKLVEYL